MPKLPVYKSEVSYSTKASSPLDSGNSAEYQRQGIKALAKGVGDVGATWQKFNDYADLVSNSKRLNDDVNNIHNEALNDPDPNNLDKYLTKLEQRREGLDSGFRNTEVGMQFSLKEQSTIDAAQAKITGIFRQKKIDKFNIDYANTTNSNRESYILNSGDSPFAAKQREQIWASQLAMVNTGFSVGALDANKYSKESNSRFEWEKARALKDAELNPAVAVENINSGKYGILESERGSVLEDVNKIFNRLSIEYEIQDNVNKYNNQKNFISEWDSGKLSLPEALDRLDIAIANGDMNEKFAKSKRNSILSSKGISATTQSRVMAELTLEANDIESSYKQGDMKYKDFLIASSNLAAKVEDAHANGELSLSDKKSMYRYINDENFSNATAELSNEKSFPFTFGYDAAFSKINSLVTDKNDAYSSLRTYFNTIQSDPKKYTNRKEKEDLIKEITSKSRRDRLNSVVNNFNTKPNNIPDSVWNKASEADKKEYWNKINGK